MDGFSAFIYGFGDFRLDTGKRLLLFQDGKIIPLMPKAYETLRYLVEHAGQVVEKEDLIAAVWPDTIVEENNLSQNISFVWKALRDKPGENRYIVTVPGKGFKFVGEVRKEANEHPVKDAPLPASATSAKTPATPWRLAVIGAVVSITILAVANWYLADRRQINSIAVMPFVNETGDPDLEYLSDGMTQTLIDNLTEIRELSVKPGSTVFRYKGRTLNAPSLGNELGVGAVMFGWVTKRGDDLTVRVELVETQTDNNLWSQSYERKVTNLVQLQGDLARNLVRSLSLKMSGTDEKLLARKATENVDAYQLYLNGQFHFRKLTVPDISKAITLLQGAIALDPAYALAYATLARAYVALAMAGESDPREFLSAKAAAKKAIELDPDLAEGHSALAVILAFYDWDWAQAENRFLRALELDPNNATTHQGYGDFLARMGRREEAAAQFDRALELEPFSPFMNTFAAISQADSDAALKKVQFAMELEPNFYLAHVIAAQILRRDEKFSDAIQELRIAKKLSPVQTSSDSILAACLIAAGQPGEARKILVELEQASQKRFVPPVNIAMVYDTLGETDHAVSMLKKGYEVRDPRLTFLKTQRVSNALREHPDFQDLLQRVGF